MSRSYDSPQAFKMAVERRLVDRARQEGANPNRLRQLLVFDRFLARLVTVFEDALVLKGGLALELRLERARTTKDIDVRVVAEPTTILQRLQEAGRLVLGDFLSFEIEPDPRHPVMDADGMRYEGQRYRATARLAGKAYGVSFGVDVAFAEPMKGPAEHLEGSSFLAFAGIPPTRVAIYPVETHIAEKLHAYTLPRERENTRVKDLPDLALLASLGNMDGADLRQAIDATFTFRKTHDVPPAVPDPPSSWEPVYARMAAEDNLPWETIADLLAAVRSFLDPVLRGTTVSWDHDTWSWSAE